MTSVEPKLWVGEPAGAIAFYALTFGAEVLHRVGHDDEVVAHVRI